MTTTISATTAGKPCARKRDQSCHRPVGPWRRFFERMLPGRARKGQRAPKTYPIAIRRFELPGDGFVEYGRWLHPKEREKKLCADHIAALRRLVPPGSFVIDVGAHTGDTAIPLALAAGRAGLTLALEPNPHVFRVLEINASLNPDKTRIVPLMLAAGGADGEQVFYYSDEGYCNGGAVGCFRKARRGHVHPLKVQVRHLGRLLREKYVDWLPRLSLIKVDTEGHDSEVLHTIRDILTALRPTIICEVYRHLTPTMRAEYFEFLDAAGYACHALGAGASLRGRGLTARDFIRRRHFDVLAIPRATRCNIVGAGRAILPP